MEGWYHGSHLLQASPSAGDWESIRVLWSLWLGRGTLCSSASCCAPPPPPVVVVLDGQIHKGISHRGGQSIPTAQPATTVPVLQILAEETKEVLAWGHTQVETS